MIINPNNFIILFDVDGTLISNVPEYDGQEPIVFAGVDPMGMMRYPIEENIQDLMDHKDKGHFVRVHSQAGVDWAERVVVELGLEAYVDSVETKPGVCVDDLPASEWMYRYFKGEKV